MGVTNDGTNLTAQTIRKEGMIVFERNSGFPPVREPELETKGAVVDALFTLGDGHLKRFDNGEVVSRVNSALDVREVLLGGQDPVFIVGKAEDVRLLDLHQGHPPDGYIEVGDKFIHITVGKNRARRLQFSFTKNKDVESIKYFDDNDSEKDKILVPGRHQADAVVTTREPLYTIILMDLQIPLPTGELISSLDVYGQKEVKKTDGKDKGRVGSVNPHARRGLINIDNEE
ncbi:MAG TPA: hypothetical protein VMR81_03875 [Patescibacteria group bacterium]|jgi:hypothetical protein|nr:hypothetical protein [Patescibacteria group bacterium]